MSEPTQWEYATYVIKNPQVHKLNADARALRPRGLGTSDRHLDGEVLERGVRQRRAHGVQAADERAGGPQPARAGSIRRPRRADRRSVCRAPLRPPRGRQRR